MQPDYEQLNAALSRLLDRADVPEDVRIIGQRLRRQLHARHLYLAGEHRCLAAERQRQARRRDDLWADRLPMGWSVDLDLLPRRRRGGDEQCSGR